MTQCGAQNLILETHISLSFTKSLLLSNRHKLRPRCLLAFPLSSYMPSTTLFPAHVLHPEDTGRSWSRSKCSEANYKGGCLDIDVTKADTSSLRSVYSLCCYYSDASWAFTYNMKVSCHAYRDYMRLLRLTSLTAPSTTRRNTGFETSPPIDHAGK